MFTLEPANTEELEKCYRIIDEGRKFQREQGFVQWSDDYPNIDTIRSDISNKKGYVLKIDGDIAAYMYIGFENDPDYASIEGKWLSDIPYAVVHRIAFSSAYRGRGLSEDAFSLIKDLAKDNGIYSIRIDTDFPNLRMQHVLEKNGFVRCGIVSVRGLPRIAYENDIHGYRA